MRLLESLFNVHIAHRQVGVWAAAVHRPLHIHHADHRHQHHGRQHGKRRSQGDGEVVRGGAAVLALFTVVPPVIPHRTPYAERDRVGKRGIDVLTG